MPLIRTVEACGISYDVLAWTAEWYVREEPLRAANLAIVSCPQRLPLTQILGGGTSRARMVSAYAHANHQHAHVRHEVIVANRP